MAAMLVNSASWLALGSHTSQVDCISSNNATVFLHSRLSSALPLVNGEILPRDVTPVPSNVVFYRDSLAYNLLFMNNRLNDRVRATAFGATDAPQDTAVVKNLRNPCRSKQKINLGAWNVRTTNDSKESCRPERATAIICRELEKAEIDICALSEVRRPGSGNIVERSHTIYWSGGSKKEAGVGFAISNKLSNLGLTLMPISDRLMFLRVQLKCGKFLKLISVYAPTMQRTQEEKEQFYEQLSNTINMNKEDYLIILGDVNARVGSDWRLWPDVMGKHGVEKMNSNGLLLLEFCTQNHLSVMGTMFQHRNHLKTTWQHLRTKHWHQLDHVLANKSAKQNITVTKVSLTADCFTDHRLLLCKCSFSLRQKSKGKRPPVKPYIKMSPDKVIQLNQYLVGKLADCPYEWENLKEILQGAANLTFGKKKKRNQDWFDD